MCPRRGFYFIRADFFPHEPIWNIGKFYSQTHSHVAFPFFNWCSCVQHLASTAVWVFSQQTDSRSLVTCGRFCCGWTLAPTNTCGPVPRTCYLLWQEYCVILWGGASGLSGWALGTLVGTRVWDKQRETYTEQVMWGEAQGEGAADQSMSTAFCTWRRQGTRSPFSPKEVGWAGGHGTVQSQVLSLPMNLAQIHSFLFSARTLVILI